MEEEIEREKRRFRKQRERERESDVLFSWGLEIGCDGNKLE